MTCRSFSEPTIKDVIKSLYGIEADNLSRLGGYADVNYYFQCNEKTTSKTPDGNQQNSLGDAYVLKIKTFNPLNDNAVMLVLSQCKAHNIAVPGFLLSLTGKLSPKLFVGECSKEIQTQVFEFVEGKTVFETKLTTNEFLIISRNVGRFCGIFTEVLGTIGSVQDDDPTEYRDDVVWRVEYSTEIVRYTHHLKDAQIQNIVKDYLEMFRSDITDRLHLLRRGFIQNDFSDSNVVLRDKHAASTKLLDSKDIVEAMGLIDFEDAHYGYTMFEISICMAYMMMRAAASDADHHTVSRELLIGYQDVHPLTVHERDSLFACVFGRIVTSYVMSIYNCVEDPDNTAVYVAQTAKCPHLIKTLWKQGKTEVMKRWF